MSKRVNIKKVFKRRNQFASLLSLGQFQQKIVKNKKTYNRQKFKKHTTKNIDI